MRKSTRSRTARPDDHDTEPAPCRYGPLALAREHYPDAGAHRPGRRNQHAPYCVGGAFAAHHLGRTVAFDPFPGSGTVAQVLVSLGLTAEAAGELAASVIHANDDGRIDRAWEILEEALAAHERQELAQVTAWRDLLEPAPGPWLVVERAPQAEFSGARE